MKWLVGIGGVGVAFVAVMGFAHTPSGRFLLPYLWLGEKCPVGADMDPGARDAVRAKVLVPAADAAPAHSRPAMGFEFGKTNLQDIDGWALAHDFQCPRDVGTVRCEDVPGAALDVAASAYHIGREAQEIRFGFDAAGLLISVDAHYDFTDPAEAIAVYQSATETLVASAGPITTERGAGTVEHLDKGALQQEKRDFFFSDYRAGLTLTNHGNDRFVLRETFQDVPRGGAAPLGVFAARAGTLPGQPAPVAPAEAGGSGITESTAAKPAE